MQTTANTSAFIEAEVYSDLVLRALHDQMLPAGMYRDVSDFPSGTNYNIKVVGSATIQDVEEDKAIAYKPIDTNTVVLNITNYEGDAFYITDKLRQDGAQIDALLSARAMEGARALAESHESSFLRVVGLTAQTASSANSINGRAHRWVADAAADNTFKVGLQDFADMKLSFDKAKVPMAGRIAIVDPVVEATLNKLAAATISMDRNPKWQEVLEDGFVREHQFLFNLFGWDIYTSNRLPVLPARSRSRSPIRAASPPPLRSRAAPTWPTAATASSAG